MLGTGRLSSTIVWHVFQDAPAVLQNLQQARSMANLTQSLLPPNLVLLLAAERRHGFLCAEREERSIENYKYRAVRTWDCRDKHDQQLGCTVPKKKACFLLSILLASKSGLQSLQPRRVVNMPGACYLQRPPSFIVAQNLFSASILATAPPSGS